MIETNKMIPLPSVVTEGRVQVHNFRLTDEAHNVDSSYERTAIMIKGQRVKSDDIVQLGLLHICVGNCVWSSGGDT